MLVPLGSGWLTLLNLSMAASLHVAVCLFAKGHISFGFFFMGPKKQIDDLLGHQMQ